MTRNLSFKISILALVAVVAGCWFYFKSATPVPYRDQPNLSQHVYIWQRKWNRAVTNAVVQHHASFSRAILLGAEINFHTKGGVPSVVYADVDWQAVQSCRRPVGIALRIGTFGGPFETNSSQFSTIARTLAVLSSAAKTNMVTVDEFHVDFDCAESKLEGYSVWLRGLQQRFPGKAVTITALPSWLKRRAAFSELISTLPHYVLQVHSLEHPRKNRTPYLCDPGTASGWMAQAARFGKPFLLALPTYSYLVAEDETGDFLGIKAEGEWNARNHDGREIKVRRLSSSPGQMAGWVKELRQRAPEVLAGIIWYRLPVEGDQLNWHWATLEKVMSGETPVPKLKTRLSTPKPGLLEIFLENSGSDEYVGLATVHLAWTNSYLVAGDGLSHFALDRQSSNQAAIVSRTNQNFIPQSSTKIGWLRFSQTNEISLETKLSTLP